MGDDLHILFSEPGRKGQSRLSPDVFVALNVPRRGTRADYDVDALGPPDFVLEVVSRSTWRIDVGRKLKCYQQIGVRECLFFDATGENRVGKGEPSAGEREGEPLACRELWGRALTPEHREPLQEVALPNGERGVRSEVLGLVAYVAERVAPVGPRETWALTMRWHDPATGKDIPDLSQSRAETRTERARANAERDRADAAEHEAQAQRTRAQAQQARADAAEDRAQAALRQVAALQQQLRRQDAP